MLREGIVPTYRWIEEMVASAKTELRAPRAQAAE
jgi:hypothetical protein